VAPEKTEYVLGVLQAVAPASSAIGRLQSGGTTTLIIQP